MLAKGEIMGDLTHIFFIRTPYFLSLDFCYQPNSLLITFFRIKRFFMKINKLKEGPTVFFCQIFVKSKVENAKQKYILSQGVFS